MKQNINNIMNFAYYNSIEYTDTKFDCLFVFLQSYLLNKHVYKKVLYENYNTIRSDFE